MKQRNWNKNLTYQNTLNLTYHIPSKDKMIPVTSEFKKAADAQSSGGIISSAQIPDVGNACTISVF